MPYPILPFASEWEQPIKFTAKPNKSQYGESGVRQKEIFMINPVSQSMPLVTTLGTESKVNLMVSFLEANIGKAIRIPYTDPLGTSADDGNLYRYKEISQTILSSTCSSFAIELKQVRRLKQIP